MMWKLIIIACCFTQLLADRRRLVDVDVDVNGGGLGGIFGAADGLVNGAGRIAKDAINGAGRIAKDAINGAGKIARGAVGGVDGIAKGAVGGVGGIARNAAGGAGGVANNLVKDATNIAARAAKVTANALAGTKGGKIGRDGSMERRGRFDSMERRGGRPGYGYGYGSGFPSANNQEMDQELEELADLKQRESFRHQYQKIGLLPLVLEFVGNVLDDPGNVGNTIVETVLTGKKKDVAANTAAAANCISSVRDVVKMRRNRGDTEMENTPVSEIMEKDCTKDCQPVMDMVPREVLDGIMCTSKNILSQILPYAEEADEDSYEAFYHPIGLGFLNTLLGGVLGGVTKAVTDTASTVTGTVLNTATGAVNKALKTGADLVDSTAGTALNAADKAVKTVGNAAGKAVDTVGNVADKAVNLAGATADQALDLGKKVGKGALGAVNTSAG